MNTRYLETHCAERDMFISSEGARAENQGLSKLALLTVVTRKEAIISESPVAASLEHAVLCGYEIEAIRRIRDGNGPGKPARLDTCSLHAQAPGVAAPGADRLPLSQAG